MAKGNPVTISGTGIWRLTVVKTTYVAYAAPGMVNDVSLGAAGIHHRERGIFHIVQLF